MAQTVQQVFKPGVVRRQVNKLDRVGINLWLTSNAVTGGCRVLLGRSVPMVGNKKARRRKAYEPKYKIILRISTRRL